VDAPWIAANLAVLNEAAVNVRLDVDFQVLAAKRTLDKELTWHFRQSYCNAGQPAIYGASDVSDQVASLPFEAVRRSGAVSTSVLRSSG
jgi:hypothetical protein